MGRNSPLVTRSLCKVTLTASVTEEFYRGNFDTMLRFDKLSEYHGRKMWILNLSQDPTLGTHTIVGPDLNHRLSVDHVIGSTLHAYTCCIRRTAVHAAARTYYASYFNFNTASSFQSKESYDSLLLRVISFNDHPPTLLLKNDHMVMWAEP